MTWLIIAIILAAAFGPITKMMPSKKERRLSALRLKARTCGLVVEIRRLAAVNPEAHQRVSAGGKLRDASFDCAAYGLHFSGDSGGVERWQILRDVQQSRNSPTPGWTWQLRSETKTGFWQAMQVVLATLPEDCLAVEFDDSIVRCYWLEQIENDHDVGKKIEIIRCALHKIVEILLGRGEQS